MSSEVGDRQGRLQTGNGTRLNEALRVWVLLFELTSAGRLLNRSLKIIWALRWSSTASVDGRKEKGCHHLMRLCARTRGQLLLFSECKMNKILSGSATESSK